MFAALYLHTPYCLSKCHYCDFNSVANPELPLAEYVELLLAEMAARLATMTLLPVASIYFGGGTPSLLSPGDVGRLVAAAAQHCRLAADAEITLEANPGTVSPASLRGYRAAGVNRLSFGIQSFDDLMLRRLGRRHTAAEARQAVAMAREAGFANIGIDLMHSLPGQTETHWQRTLEEAVALAPEHISAYGLTIEEGTPLAVMVARQELPEPEEEPAAAMLEMTAALLRQAGYDHYEISNFARPGRRSRHNLTYWRRGDYLGFGAGAHSFCRSPDDGVRWENPALLRDYAAFVRQGPLRQQLTRLSRQEAMAEFFFLGLRLIEGVDLEAFAAEFGVTAEEVFPGVIERQQCCGLLLKEGGRLRLTARGLLLANRVMAEFV